MVQLNLKSERSKLKCIPITTFRIEIVKMPRIWPQHLLLVEHVNVGEISLLLVWKS